LAVDHDHITGNVRGLLCSNCNRGLGLLKDDIKLFKKSIIYLKSALSEEDVERLKDFYSSR